MNDIFTLQYLIFYFKCTHGRVPTILLPSSLETPRVTIIIQDKDTNPEIVLVILREPENVLNFIYHYCLEVCQLLLLVKSTPMVLMVSQIILNSACWPAMKIAVKLETATYAPALKLACLWAAVLTFNPYLLISLNEIIDINNSFIDINNYGHSIHLY